MKKEESLQLSVCNYLRLQYPATIFMSDIASGMRLSIGQAVKAKKLRSSRGQPDLFIAEQKRVLQPVLGIRQEFEEQLYSGLFIELKREGVRLKKKDGSWADDHISEQAAVLEALRNRGYYATFAVGFDEAKRIIDEYLQ